MNTFLTIHCHNCLASLYHVQCLYRPMKASLFENWNRNFFRMRNRLNSWRNVRTRMLVFLPNTCCVYHVEITVSYMVVGFAPNHWNSMRQTFAFSFGLDSKYFLTIVVHNMRTPLLVLITKMNFKICLVGTLDEEGYVKSDEWVCSIHICSRRHQACFCNNVSFSKPCLKKKRRLIIILEAIYIYGR